MRAESPLGKVKQEDSKKRSNQARKRESKGESPVWNSLTADLQTNADEM